MSNWLESMLKKFLGVFAIAIAIIAASSAKATDFDFFGLSEPAQKIVINARKRQLLLVYGDGHVRRYPVAVPKAGKEWTGTTYIEGMYERPDWVPPADVAADHPELPRFIPGGSSRNPMGARAITLETDQVAIHGTTRRMRRSIGTAASYGCIRMRNEDVIDLYKRVGVGTPVEIVY
jgi:lipoprotein-anchoring transpeptidase ErfK/SrfK